jgi:hypothetical protein
MSENEIEEEIEKEELQEEVQSKEEYIGGGDIPVALDETLGTAGKHRPSGQQKPKSKEDNNFAKVSRQLEKQTGQLAMLGAISQRHLKNADIQSRMLKEINTSVKQLQRQLAQIQKAVEKIKPSKTK